MYPLTTISTSNNFKIIGHVIQKDDNYIKLLNPMMYDTKMMNEGLIFLMERYDLTSTVSKFLMTSIVSIEPNVSDILSDHYTYKVKLYEQLLDESYKVVVSQQTTSLSSLFVDGILIKSIGIKANDLTNVVRFNNKLH